MIVELPFTDQGTARFRCRVFSRPYPRLLQNVAIHILKSLANPAYRRESRFAVSRVGIGMCGLVTFVHGPCTAVESVPNSRLVPAMVIGRRSDRNGS